MAMTVAPKAVLDSGLKSHVPGDLKQSIIQLTFGAADTYVTGGFTLLPANFGFDQKIVMVNAVGSQVGGFQFAWVASTQKLKCFSAAGTELANASALLQNDIIVLDALGY